jgi:hypothetical protein
VTITCPHGTVLEARLLSHQHNEIRAVAAGCDDTLVFTRFHSTWISEELDPVVIEFAWQRRKPFPVTSEDNCVCSKELANRLIHSLLRGSESETESDTLNIFSAEESQASGQRPELRPV